MGISPHASDRDDEAAPGVAEMLPYALVLTADEGELHLLRVPGKGALPAVLKPGGIGIAIDSVYFVRYYPVALVHGGGSFGDAAVRIQRKYFTLDDIGRLHFPVGVAPGSLAPGYVLAAGKFLRAVSIHHVTPCAAHLGADALQIQFSIAAV